MEKKELNSNSRLVSYSIIILTVLVMVGGIGFVYKRSPHDLQFVACGKIKVQVTEVGREDSGLAQGQFVDTELTLGQVGDTKVDIFQNSEGKLVAMPSTNNFCRDLDSPPPTDSAK